MKRIIFIRHATTPWNREMRLQGHVDTSIDDGGREETVALVKKLEEHDIEKIISSDLLRAVETARIIGDAFNLPIITDPRLRECSFGELEGLTQKEAFKKYGSVTQKEGYDDSTFYDFSIFGGESRDDVLSRHQEFLDELQEKDESENLLLVGHGTGLNTLFASLGERADLKRGEIRVLEF